MREFIKTFIEGDLIPAIILWRSPGGTFIIDGAHRLSALIAWVDNDFGDGTVSTEFSAASFLTIRTINLWIQSLENNSQRIPDVSGASRSAKIARHR